MREYVIERKQNSKIMKVSPNSFHATEEDLTNRSLYKGLKIDNYEGTGANTHLRLGRYVGFRYFDF